MPVHLEGAEKSGLGVLISGQHVFVESGVHVITQPEIAVSGMVSVQSGVYLASGIHVVTAAGSGQHVQISGQHVFVESGVHIVGTFTAAVSGKPVKISGEHVWISGQHVFVESGLHVVVESGIGVTATVTAQVSGQPVKISGEHVWISGQHVFVESGTHVVVESGIGVTATVTAQVSGQPVKISGESVWISGQHVFVESGLHVVVESGIGVTATVTAQVSGQPVKISGESVWISGQHVFVESGVHIVGGATAAGTSGQVIHVGCAAVGRTGKLVQAIGGTSGSHPGSGGMSLCVSGYWCSGPIHTLIVKNKKDNDDIYVGFSNCKPYSGYGFPLAESEGVNLDMCDLCDVYVWAQTSGQAVAFIGTDY